MTYYCPWCSTLYSDESTCPSCKIPVVGPRQDLKTALRLLRKSENRTDLFSHRELQGMRLAITYIERLVE